MLYIGGHGWSKKLSTQVTKVGSSIKKLVSKYNEGEWSAPPRVLSLTDVFNRGSQVFRTLQSPNEVTSTTSTAPQAVKHAILRAWHL